MSSILKNFFLSNLKLYGEKGSITQTELADMLGVKPNTISNYENKKSKPDLDDLLKIVNIFDVNVHEFLTLDNQKTSETRFSLSDELEERSFNEPITTYENIDINTKLSQLIIKLTLEKEDLIKEVERLKKENNSLKLLVK